MPEETTTATETFDVKDTGTASSAEPKGETTTEQSPGSEQTATETKKQTLDDVIKDVVEKATESSTEEKQKTEGEEGEESLVKNLNETEEKKDEESADEDKKDQEKGPVAYERFTEVNEKAKNFESEVGRLKPLAEAQESVIAYCRENAISSEQFSEWMSIAALVNADPAEAVKLLEPKLAQLKSTTGDELPADLKEAVARGELNLDHAKRIAKAEGTAKLNVTRSKVTQDRWMANEQARLANEMSSAVTSWLKSKGKTDPDFVAREDEDSPMGKYEFVMNEFATITKTNMQKINSSADLVKLLAKAYDNVSAALGKFTPKPNGQKVVTSSKSTTTSSKTEPKTLEELVARRAAEKHGIVMPAPRK